MLSKIVVDKVATFNSAAALDETKKVNLVYGLNGTGKSTICRFLRDPNREGYENCQLHQDGEADVFVFNDEFIEENFYQSADIKGIFSLSKENKEAEEELSDLGKDRGKLEEDKRSKVAEHQRLVAEVQRGIDIAVDKTFDIKRSYSGGDRVLEFCLDGVMAKKEKLFRRLIETEKPAQKPQDTISNLQEEAKLLQQADVGHTEVLLPQVEFDLSSYEKDPLLEVAVVGSSGSSFAEFITKLRASDWVKQGLEFIDPNSQVGVCPFCQSETIDEHVRQELANYFDATFESQLSRLRDVLQDYEVHQAALPSLEMYKKSLFYDSEIGNFHAKLSAALSENLSLLQRKMANPSIAIALIETRSLIDELNSAVQRANDRIERHNMKIMDVGKARRDLHRRFWELMRWEYDQTLALYEDQKARIDKLDANHAEELRGIETALGKIEEAIKLAQQKTVNIDDAVRKINSNLLDVGIVDFRIKKHSDHLYRLERVSQGESSFKNLSEGEKMIISLLYFCELCVGRSSPNELTRPKIAVFDDPVSSMSHVFVFNVGRILVSKFFKEDRIAQVFVFTHSLYFFYELTDTDHDRREKMQALFRVSKNLGGSSVSKMRYEEIQNDYHAYWQIINDPDQHPAVIANCMRNVIEYFFGFVEKQSFANVFQKKELQENRFQAFCRYMNRESHSFGQNVFDFKEFDYNSFKEGLRLVFDLSGYPLHYKKMAKMGV